MEWMPKNPSERPDKVRGDLTPEAVDKAPDLTEAQREMLRAAIAQVREEEQLIRSETAVPVSERAAAEFETFEEHTRQTAMDANLARWDAKKNNEEISKKLPGYNLAADAVREDLGEPAANDNDNEAEGWELDKRA